jgi:microcystin-dependent protein
MAMKKIFASIRGAFAALLVLPFAFASTPAAACAELPLLGSLCLFAGNYAPRGWAFADGQLLPIATNTSLFSIIGTTYGGDGRSTFALPDLRGRAPLSAGSGPGLPNFALGQAGGGVSTSLTDANLPNHTHTATVSTTVANEDGNTDLPAGAVWASDGRNEIYFSGTPTNADQLAGNAVTVSIGNTGGSQTFSTQSPYLTLNWLIATQGVFPVRP